MNMTRSKKIIADLMANDPGIHCAGFAKAMRQFSWSSEFIEAVKAVIPDGYKITEGEVILFEVADTHPIRRAKALKLAELADEVDMIGRVLRVVVFDYTGHVLADTPGWAYMPAYLDVFAPPNCMDMVPAARAVYADFLHHEQAEVGEAQMAVFRSPHGTVGTVMNPTP